eukprot:6527608-Heterocapsa_arctica.AAC.1
MRPTPAIDLEQDMHDQDIVAHTKSRECEFKDRCRKDGRYRLGRTFLKTYDNGNDTRGHRSIAKLVENIECRRADE